MQAGTQYLTFFVAGEEVGVEIDGVREIVAFETATRIPSTPAWIRGVMNLRGAVLPVLDLAVKFGFGPTAIGARTCVVLIQLQLADGTTTPIGVLADSVNDVLEIRQDDIETPPPFGTPVQLEFLRGMVPSENGFVLLLDIQRVLTHEEASLTANVRPAAAATDEKTTPGLAADGS
jgi:purine-binding chemotaxis protein CheW